MICVDANVLIAALDSADLFHLVASEVLVGSENVVALNVTWAEALVHPDRVGQVDAARGLLTEYGIGIMEVANEVALTASALRAAYGNRNFPMLDALVVSAALHQKGQVITTDAKWPSIPDVDIRVLARPAGRSSAGQD
ncbi:hypothetical protein BH24ACT5_BH24ACT5_08660 [soil metagenome]